MSFKTSSEHSISKINKTYILHARTVVRIHINAATLAPMAQAPAMPPRAADAADFSTISRNDNCCLGVTTDGSLLLLLMIVTFIFRVYVYESTCIVNLPVCCRWSMVVPHARLLRSIFAIYNRDVILVLLQGRVPSKYRTGVQELIICTRYLDGHDCTLLRTSVTLPAK